MIPKKIHYIWFGPNKKSKLMQKCITSWHQLHPNWEIIEWNNSNFDFNECDFVKAAYENKNWTFLADYYELKILFLHGGIYLDTDMLLIKPLDQLLNNKMFWGYEAEKVISCGIIGCENNNKFIESILHYYEKLDYNNWNKNSMPKNVNEIFNSGNFSDITFYPIDFFYPYPLESRLNELNVNYKKYITENTLGIHMWEFSWSYFSWYQLFLRDKHFFKAFLCFFKEAFTKSETLKWKELKKTVKIILGKYN